MNNEDRALLYDTAERIFAQHCPPALLAEAEAGAFPRALWTHLSDAGLLSALAPEAQGGVEAPLSVLAGLLRIAGRAGAPGPMAETMVGRWLLAAAGVDAPDKPLLLAINGWRTSPNGLSAIVRRTPDALVIATKLEGDTAALKLVPMTAFETRERRTLAGETMAHVSADTKTLFDQSQAIPAPLLQRALRMLSVARAALIVGAIEKIMELSLVYSGQRVQFGRQISKFQAVQQQLAALAGAAAAASAITLAAAREADRDGGDVLLDAARVRLGDIIDLVASVGHQVHGAIGVTREYQLQYFTRRLWAWRDEAVNLPQARQRLAARFAADNSDELWPQIVKAGAGA